VRHQPAQLGGTLSALEFLRCGVVVLAVVSAAACTGVTGKSVGSSSDGTAVLEVDPASISFGTVAEGSTASQAVSIINNGTAGATIKKVAATGTGFSVKGISLPASLPAGTSVSLTAVFAPSADGAATGSISISSDASGSPIVIGLKGTGATATLTATPASATFNGVVVGVGASQSIQLQAQGTTNVQITGVTASGTGFSVSGLAVPLTLSPGKSVSFTAAFKPASTGSDSGRLSITSTADGSPLNVSLSGTAVNPTVGLSVSPASITFSGQAIGKSASQEITLKNTGNTNVTISGVTVAGAGFSLSSGGGTNIVLTPGQQQTLTVAFAPAQTGSVSGTLTISSNAPGSPLRVPLSGLASTTAAAQHAVTLNWNASVSPSIIGYYVYRATPTGQFFKLNSTAEASTTYEDTSVASGLTYYYVVTAVSSAQVESTSSNQVSVTVPND